MNQTNEETKDTVEVKLFDFGKIAGYLMPKEKATTIHLKDKSLVNTANLMELLDCGKHTAIEIGNKAGAKVCIGRKLFWNAKLIQQYLDNIAE